MLAAINEEWTAKYWQWITSQPKDSNPLKTGQVRRRNADSFIAFPCTGGGEDCNRKIKLSGEDAKKEMLVPVFTAIASSAEGTQNTMRKRARQIVMYPKFSTLILDDIMIKPTYIETDEFQIDIPENNVLMNETKAGKYMAVSCGYWGRVGPLPKGKHCITFGGTGRSGFSTKVQYIVEVD